MSLCLCSTAPLCINMHAQLWFQRTTHPSPCDSGASDNGPVLAQHAEQEAFTLDRERFTQTRRSCLEPDRSVGKEPIGEPSLSAGAECLSLYAQDSTHVRKKQEMRRACEIRNKGCFGAIPPPFQRRGTPCPAELK